MSTKKHKFTLKDKFYMEIALDLARARHGLTGSNPSVGCVIVKNDKIISIGQTSFNGRPHAESNAIKNSFEDLKGSKMYVTLEPCCHHGLTPPCTDSIIKSKISEVIYSVTDIDKRVSNKSFKILNSKKIVVKKGLLKNKIENFYHPYFINRKKKLPYVTGKIAISKNNIIYTNYQKKITNNYSDQFSHLLRYQNDGLMITYKTLNKDNPRLNCRLKGLENFSPKRIILDSKLNSKINSYIIKTAKNKKTLIFYNKADKSKISKFKRNGIILIKCKVDRDNKFDMSKILKKLYNFGCRNLLIEGGNDLTNSLIKNKIFNKFYLFKSPKNLPKSSEYLKFSGLNTLNQKYQTKINLNLNLRKDRITLYR
ncbi:bifunctional diaminohydroxyphosphoribosylaminopyrimidine deaminase/5-amino-6-(5-phosphoribosylamino)uracil reductase RibD [Candidatus Pelagibacter sp.]|uniref:bifunctional diaminohydroxyphosphoribosylaminopyrimidine deaminase/5-amino-6-(5-phosphoribosylamino)uracil reductase RibD n=1 Tax=Candidatus Pelagibacter sp. TaxID=2024849 RepID=UPI003F869BA8